MPNDTVLDFYPVCNMGYSKGFCDVDEFLAHRIIGLTLGTIVFLVVLVLSIHTLTYRRDMNDSFILRIFIAVFALSKIIGFGAGIGGAESFIFLAFFYGMANASILSAYLYLFITWLEAYFNVTKNSKGKGNVVRFRPLFLSGAIFMFSFIIVFETLQKCRCVDNYQLYGTIAAVVQGIIIIGIVIALVFCLRLMLNLVRGRQSERMNFLKVVVILSLINALLLIVVIIVPLAAGRHSAYLIITNVVACWAAIIMAFAGSPQKTRQTFLFCLNLGRGEQRSSNSSKTGTSANTNTGADDEIN